MKKQFELLKKENQELRKEVEKLKDLVTIDSLTQVYNRHAFTHFLKNLCREVKWTANHIY
jgi:GGDEF domain-containing protein